ncbi:MAG: hypothetical protein ACI4QC_07640 [Thermoguttaceae bacterium]
MRAPPSRVASVASVGRDNDLTLGNKVYPQMKKEIYADGVGQIHFAGNMVRFDFITLQPGAEGDAPKPEPSERVIMPPQGFLSMFNSMQQLIDKLVEAGVLQKNNPNA